MLSTLTAIYAPRLFSLIKDRKGVTSLEYAVLAVGIVGAVAVAAAALGGSVSTLFGDIGTKLTYGG